MLTPEDWATVSGALVAGANPLHDRNAQRFATLRHGILRVAETAAVS